MNWQTGEGSETATLDELRDALLALAEWLREAGVALADLHANGDGRYGRAVAKLSSRQAVYRALQTRIAALVDEGASEQRYPFLARWTREKGWLEVRDVFTGEWHQLQATNVPDWWRRAATRQTQQDRAKRGGVPGGR